MAKLRSLTDSSGTKIYPISVTDGIYNASGQTLTDVISTLATTADLANTVGAIVSTTEPSGQIKGGFWLEEM